VHTKIIYWKRPVVIWDGGITKLDKLYDLKFQELKTLLLIYYIELKTLLLIYYILLL
jgi:hypothetical protein